MANPGQEGLFSEIAVVPYYNYSMNIYLGSKSAASGGGVQRLGSALAKEA